ncbi:putative Beta-propeller domains of methanol dehydrogenase type [Candidatus Sulfopaludibacter sp. SbA4]|nr:putative Beta-propeller domains of methanol dehydrogenase type [Candidatus Sulfopaludibacter sp. SbA4]
MLLLRSLLVVFAFVSTVLLDAAETPIPPSPTQWVTDTANFLSPEAVRSLDARLAAYEQATGHQLLVYIAPTTGDAPIEDWAVRAFANWKVGRKGLDDGLALFIMPQDHKMRIEVGYGLEAVVPDAVASRVINEVVAPRIQAGHPDDAVTAAIDSLTGVIGGQGDAPPSTRTPPQSKPLTLFQWIFYGIAGILVLALVITHPTLAFYFLASIMSGGSGGGGGGGGGGFSGGGGRSGGGGASGSW